jgi:hypothetical protein
MLQSLLTEGFESVFAKRCFAAVWRPTQVEWVGRSTPLLKGSFLICSVLCLKKKEKEDESHKSELLIAAGQLSPRKASILLHRSTL